MIPLYRDITKRFKDNAINIIFNHIKDVLNWDEIQKFVPNKLFLYSDKKKCQLILALMDASTMGLKFGMDKTEQRAFVKKYMKNLGFLRSLQYIQAYREFHLVNIFNLFPDYDDLLRQVKYSTNDAIEIVNLVNLEFAKNISQELVNDTNNACNIAMNSPYGNIDDDQLDEYEDYKENMANIIAMTITADSLAEAVERLQCNYARCHSNLESILFDLQSLNLIAFDPRYKRFQKDMDEWKLLSIKKFIANINNAILDEIQKASKVDYSDKFDINKELMIREHIHNFDIFDDNGFHLEFEFSYEDPMIINM